MRYAASIAGCLCGTGIALLALWAWGNAPLLAAGAERAHAEAAHAEPAVWSIRLTGVAGLAIAQVLFLKYVVARFYRPGGFDRALRSAAGVLAGASLVAAIAIALLACLAL